MILSKGNLNPTFPFLPSYINYILENVGPELLLKLYQCCKYFYFKLKVTIAQSVKFENLPNEKNVKFSFGIFYRSYNYNGNKLWLTDKLTISSFETPSLICGPIGNYFLNKIYRNNLKELYIYGGYILFKELEVLSESPNLIKFGYHAAVKNDDGHSMALFEVILVLFPNIKYLSAKSPHFTKETFKKLFKFKFHDKIKELEFWDIQSEFDPISLCDFLKENFDVNAVFHLSFERNTQLKNQLLPQVKALIDSWEKIKLKHFFC